MNLIQAESAALAYMNADIPLYAHGAPGVGKSELFAALAKKTGRGFIDLRLGQMDPVDLRGLPTVADGGTAWARPDFWPVADRDGPSGILLFDELSDAPRSIQSAAYQVILNRRAGPHILPPGWWPVAAGNRRADRAAAGAISTALANRFAHIEIEPDVTAWAAWANVNGISPELVAFIRYRPALIHNLPEGGAVSFPSPRAWAQVSKIMAHDENMIRTLATGLVGEGAAAELCGFLKVYRTLPPVAEILAQPDKAKCPDESDPATCYAVASLLARVADAKNFAAVLKYAARLPREFNVMLTVDAVKRDVALAETSAFTAWAQKNQDVTL